MSLKPTACALARDRRTPPYQRHSPERTALYQKIKQYSPAFAPLLGEQKHALPAYVRRELKGYLRCGRLQHGFLRVCCATCHAEHLVAFGCKGRGFCASCGARRMAESAALLVDDIIPEQPVRQQGRARLGDTGEAG
jgi:hypothetical protein